MYVEMLALVVNAGGNLQNQALLALATLACQKSRTSCGLEHLTNTVVGLGRAFEIFVCTNLLADFLTLSILSAGHGPQ